MTSVSPIVVDHFKTLRSARDNSFLWPDFAVLYGIPIVVVVWSCLVRWEQHEISDILVAVSLLAGLLFNLLVPVFEIANKAKGDGFNVTAGVGEYSNRAVFIRHLYSNISYAILVALSLGAIFGGAAALGSDHLGAYFSGVVAGLLVHFILMLGAILKRMRAAFLNESR